MKMNKLRCVVIEDEEDLRQWLVKKLQQFPELEIIGEASSVDEAYALIATNRPEVAFMDVHLIGGDAFTLLSRLQSNGMAIPHIVMATGDEQSALTALNDYRQYIVQYLVKPFVEDWRTKFRKSVDAVIAAEVKNRSIAQTVEVSKADFRKEAEDYTFIPHQGQLLRLKFAKIVYLEAAGSGMTIVVMENTQNQVGFSLNKFMGILPDYFVRISKTNVVNTKRILRLDRGERIIEIENKGQIVTLGITNRYYRAVLDRLPLSY